MLLKNNNITFADRPGQTFSTWDVFETLFKTESIYVYSLTREGLPPPVLKSGDLLFDLDPKDPFDKMFADIDDLFYNKSRAAEKESHMAKGRIAFNNTDASKLPDGGAMYG